MWLQNEFGNCFKYNIHFTADLYAQSLFLALKCQFSEWFGSPILIGLFNIWSKTIHKSTQCFFSYFFVWYFVRTNIQPDWLNKNSGHIYLQYSVKCIFSNLSGILKQRKSRCVYFSPIYYVLPCNNIHCKVCPQL